MLVQKREDVFCLFCGCGIFFVAEPLGNYRQVCDVSVLIFFIIKRWLAQLKKMSLTVSNGDIPILKVAVELLRMKRGGKIFCNGEFFCKYEHSGKSLCKKACSPVSTSCNFTLGTGYVNENREKGRAYLWKQDKGSDTDFDFQRCNSVYFMDLHQ